MPEGSCAWCGKAFKPGEQRVVPRPIAAAAVLAFAFLHAGMWLAETLPKPLCRRCRSRLQVALALASALILGGALAGAYLWISMAREVAAGR